MEIKTLDGVAIADIADTFNIAFSDYLVPIKLSETDLSNKMAAENTSLNFSAGAFDNGKLVAFILIGITEDVAYNGGTGVIPAYRGQNLTRRLYDFLFPLLAENGIFKHQLEVITGNVRAIPVYEKIGFTTTRTVTCFKGNVCGQVKETIAIRDIELTEMTAEMFDFEPTYQNRIEAILRTPEQHRAIGAFVNEKLVGFVVFAPAAARIKLFGVANGHRRKGIGHALFQTVQQNLGNSILSLINVDASDGSIQFLERIGFSSTVSQYDMTFTYVRTNSFPVLS